MDKRKQIAYTFTTVIAVTSPTTSVLLNNYLTNNMKTHSTICSSGFNYVCDANITNIYSDFLRRAIQDGLRRYEKLVSHKYTKLNFCLTFFSLINEINPFSDSLISFHDDSIIADINVNGKYYTISIDFELPNKVFISTMLYTANKHRMKMADYSINDVDSVKRFINA